MAGVKVAGQPPLDGINLIPILKGEEQKLRKPIGFWDSAERGRGVPATEWMEELLAAQARGEEPANPERLVMDAGKIGPPVPLDSFPGHSAWLDWPWKLHRIQNPKTRALSWELYNLATDPAESRALPVAAPGPGPALQAALTNWLASVARSLNGDDYR